MGGGFTAEEKEGVIGWRVYSRGEGRGELGGGFTAEEKEGVIVEVEGLQQRRGRGENGMEGL